MSTIHKDLQVTNAISSSLEQVKDASGNTSNLYVASDAVAIGTSSAPSETAALVVDAPGGTVGFQTVRPSDTSVRVHWQAYSGTSQVFAFNVLADDSLCLNVGGTEVMIIDQSGNMTLNVASLTINGLGSAPDGTATSELEIADDGSVYAG